MIGLFGGNGDPDVSDDTGPLDFGEGACLAGLDVVFVETVVVSTGSVIASDPMVGITSEEWEMVNFSR
jgi:hypothetical protein